jgi:hypothetical protein
MPSVGWCLVWALSGRLCSPLTSFAVVELSRSSLTSCAVEKRFCEGRNPVALSLSCRVIANGFAAPEGSPRGTAGFRPPAGGRVTSLLRAQKRSNQEKGTPGTAPYGHPVHSAGLSSEPHRRTGSPKSSARPARTFRKSQSNSNSNSNS